MSSCITKQSVSTTTTTKLFIFACVFGQIAIHFRWIMSFTRLSICWRLYCRRNANGEKYGSRVEEIARNGIRNDSMQRHFFHLFGGNVLEWNWKNWISTSSTRKISVTLSRVLITSTYFDIVCGGRAWRCAIQFHLIGFLHSWREAVRFRFFFVSYLAPAEFHDEN